MTLDEWIEFKKPPCDLLWGKKPQIIKSVNSSFPYKLWMRQLPTDHPIYYVILDQQMEDGFKKSSSNSLSYAIEKYEGT